MRALRRPRTAGMWRLSGWRRRRPDSPARRTIPKKEISPRLTAGRSTLRRVEQREAAHVGEAEDEKKNERDRAPMVVPGRHRERGYGIDRERRVDGPGPAPLPRVD